MIEKILERLREEKIKAQEYRGEKLKENDYTEANVTHGRIQTLNEVEEIVQEVAKEYGNVSDNDLAVVSALPSLYPLQPFEEEAIHKVVASVKDGDWIPCSSGQMPTECEEVNVTIEDDEGALYTTTSWMQDGVWVVKKTALHPKVIAWKPKDAPYQKGDN